MYIFIAYLSQQCQIKLATTTTTNFTRFIQNYHIFPNFTQIGQNFAQIFLKKFVRGCSYLFYLFFIYLFLFFFSIKRHFRSIYSMTAKD